MVLTDGTLKCWGSSISEGQIGGFPVAGASIVTVPNVRATAVSVGYAHTCFLDLTTGEPWCFGRNGERQFGSPLPVNSATPVRVPGWPGGRASVLAAGSVASCAIASSDSSLWCWGEYFSYALGLVTSSNGAQKLPVGPMTTVAMDHASFGSNGNNAGVGCASDGGQAICWGDNQFGQLGRGATGFPGLPGPAIGVTDTVQLASGGLHYCAAIADAGALCWGLNLNGKLGNPDGGPLPRPLTVMTEPVLAVATGAGHSCALIVDGGVRCWGDNTYEALGGAPDAGVSYPILPGAASMLSAGGSGTCAFVPDAGLYCWGPFPGFIDAGVANRPRKLPGL